MVTRLRIHEPFVTYHVRLKAVRGNELYRDDEDRQTFLSLCDRYLRPEEAEVLAWVLIPNHAHMQIRVGAGPLSVVMHRLETHYAVYYNRRHGPDGHVFKDRFWWKPVRDDGYFVKLQAYIHGSPVKDGVASIGDLAAFPWCSYGTVLGVRPARRFHCADVLLSVLAPGRDAARRIVVATTAAEIERHRQEPTGDALRRLEIRVAVACAKWCVDIDELRTARVGDGARARREVVLGASADGLPDHSIAHHLHLDRTTIWRIRRTGRL